MHASPSTIPGLRPGLTENGSALRTNTPSAPSQMRYYTGDVFSQPRPTDLTARADRHRRLVSMLPTDRVSGHDTTALDDAADLTA